MRIPKAPTNRQKIEAAARLVVGPIIETNERLIALGFSPKAHHKVLFSTTTDFYRDLAPVRSLTIPALPHSLSPISGAAKRTLGRSPIAPRRILDSRDPVKLLTACTPDELIEAEAVLPDLLDAREARRDATESVRSAYMTRKRVAEAVEVLAASSSACPFHAKRRRSVIEWHREAKVIYDVAQKRLDQARAHERRVRGLPPPRSNYRNHSRHRPVNGRRRYQRWWNLLRGSQAPRGRAHWNDIGESGAIYFAGEAAYRFGGRVLAVTLNLSAKVDAAARLSGKPAAWLLARVTRRLKQIFKRHIQVALALEENNSGLLHAHMIVANLSMTDAGAVTQALALAGGKGFRGHRKQVNIKPQFDSGWCSYCAKEFTKPWPWAHRIAMTENLRREAQQAYADRLAFISEHAR